MFLVMKFQSCWSSDTSRLPACRVFAKRGHGCALRNTQSEIKWSSVQLLASIAESRRRVSC